MKNSVIIGLALIAVVFSFMDCTVKSEEDLEEDYVIPDIVRKGVRQLHKPKQFLAGEDTPCWRVTHNGLRLNRIQEQPVKKAVDHWKKNRGKDILWRKGRSVNFTATNPYIPDFLHRRSIEMPENITKVVRRSAPTGRSPGPVDHVYPTILVVMDYLAEQEYDRHEFDENGILTRIKYALAFWNSVNIRLRRIKRPIIQLRIGGIVIGNGAFRKKYSENWWRKPDESYRTMSQLFRENDVWRDEIPPSSYDFIVHMTSQLKRNFGGVVPQYAKKDAFDAYSEWKTPCGPYPQSVGDVIFWDDFAFSGVQSAVNHLIHVFGVRDMQPVLMTTAVGEMMGSRYTLYAVRESSDCARDLVPLGLEYAWCMSQPKKHFPPGKRVPIIMPGDILSRYLRCLNFGFWMVVPKGEECGQFMCSYGRYSGNPNQRIGLDVDGTSCQSDKVCINSKCTTKTWGDD